MGVGCWWNTSISHFHIKDKVWEKLDIFLQEILSKDLYKYIRIIFFSLNNYVKVHASFLERGGNFMAYKVSR
jgi:hypothetical protein